MKFSVSTYSLSGLVGKNGVTEKDLIKIAKEIGFDGIEFAEINPPENKDKIEYAKELNEECKRVGITPVQYSIGADFLNNDLATALGTNPVSAIAWSTRSFFSSSTFAVPFITRETVAGETPASFATSIP